MRDHRLQRGQAIVVIALTIGVLCGMTGLAIDLGRGFVDRRAIQNASDAAADAGYWTYYRSIESPASASSAFTLAEQAMLGTYEINRGLNTPTCSPGWQNPPVGGTVTFGCSFGSDSSQSLTLTVTDVQIPEQYEVFQAAGAQQLATAFIQIVGSANSFNDQAVGAEPFARPPSPAPSPPGCASPCASRLVLPVVLAVDPSCSGGTSPLLVKGNDAAAAVVGNVVSYGSLFTSGSDGPISGDTSWYCGADPTVTSWCYYNPAPGPCSGVQKLGTSGPGGRPPMYPMPVATGSGTSQTTSGLEVNLSAGTYDATTGLPYASFGGPSTYTNGCWFLGAGVYKFDAQLNLASGIFSNELRPPDEPVPGSISTVQSPQFWNQNGVHCAGSFGLAPILDTPGLPGLPTGAFGIALPAGIYAVRLTSVRQDNGVTRESAPSACRSLNLASPEAVQVSISNVPGATAYNIYVSAVGISGGTGTCSGPFFQLLQVPAQNLLNETNANTSGCPSTSQTSNCSLGVTVGAFDDCEIDQVNQILAGLPSPPPLPSGCPLPSPPALPQPTAPNCGVQVPPPLPPLPPSPPNPLTPPTPPSCSWPTASFHELLAPAAAGLPDQDPAVGQEFANWGLCAQPDSATSHNKLTACQNGAGGYDPTTLQTPGAVQLQEAGTGCFTFSSSGLPFLFSGYQYAWGLAVQRTAAGCLDDFSPASGGELVGHVFAPASSVRVTAATRYVPNPLEAPAVYGCVTGYDVDLEVADGLAVYFVPPPYNNQGYGIPTGSPGPGC